MKHVALMLFTAFGISAIYAILYGFVLSFAGFPWSSTLTFVGLLTVWEIPLPHEREHSRWAFVLRALMLLIVAGLWAGEFHRRRLLGLPVE